MVQIREKDIEDIEAKLETMNTPLNKINYLETATKDAGFSWSPAIHQEL